MKRVMIALGFFVWLIDAGTLQARQVYCFAMAQKTGNRLEQAFGNQCTLLLTPIFPSDASLDLLSAEFEQAQEDASLATCVTDEYQPDITADRQNLLDGAKADNCAVVPRPAPIDEAAPQPTQ